MRHYNLGFISDEDIYKHVKQTVLQYRRSINLEEFNKNVIDPIKLTFDSKIYGYDLHQTIESECIRQIDKTNNNRIGYFHQYLFRYAGNGWEVPANGAKGGFDVINESKHIFVEMKNKHNTMNSSSAGKTYMKMQHKILQLRPAKAFCYILDISAQHTDKPWAITIRDNEHLVKYQYPQIRIISPDIFYSIIFRKRNAYTKLYKALPTIIDDVLKEQ